MHIDWFVVVGLTIAFVFAGYSLWLTGKGKDEKGDEIDKSISR